MDKRKNSLEFLMKSQSYDGEGTNPSALTRLKSDMENILCEDICLMVCAV